MRTKALVCAAVFAAGVISSMAQVYSVNVVGYYNVTIPANQYVLLANQLNTTNNTLPALIPNGPPGAIFQKLAAGYSAYVFDDVDMIWTPDASAVTLNPGEGGLYKSPSATTLTFVGEVMQGSLANTLPLGLNAIRSSMVPQAGLVTTTLGVPGEPGDICQILGAGYSAYVFDDVDLIWTPSEPSVNVGQAFLYKKVSTGVSSSWVRNFTVN